MNLKTKCLVGEKPLLTLPTLACELGLGEAIILQQIYYWLQVNGK